MKATYEVRTLQRKEPVIVTVPGSKSITNRALMLAAMSNSDCLLEGVLFSDDSRAFLDCLHSLGFSVEVDEPAKKVRIQGTGGHIPNRQAEIQVRSAGTAARFLTVMLALAGGDYVCNASEQMKKRPMQPLMTLLSEAGVQIEYLEQEGHFPFILHSHQIQMKEVVIDTTLSSQFASALLMAGVLLPEGLRVSMTGSRTAGSYIRMTLSMMEQFGIRIEKETAGYYISGGQSYGRSHYQIEPDVSGACYFYSMAPLLGVDVLVRDVHTDSLQGDIRYVQLMQQLGCRLEDEPEGIWLRGKAVTSFPGISVNMKDFSDQTMTMAALAVYAESDTEITDIGHIRVQESDRLQAILTEMSHLGIACEEVPEKDGLRIHPGSPMPGFVHTYEDHRMAMAFALLGLRTPGIIIDNPQCCGKTFENYFEVLDSLYEG